MRHLKPLIALIALATCVFLWFSNHKATPAVAASPSKQRSAADASDPASIERPTRATGERESLEPTSTTAEQAFAPPDGSAATSAFSYWGKLVNGHNRQPIGGVTVIVLGEGESKRLTSDDDGRFHITDGSYEDDVVRVDATGFGSVLTKIASGHDEPEEAAVLVLWRAAAIDARVLDSTGTPLVGATVSASSSAFKLVRPEGSDLFGPVPVRTYGTKTEWSAQTGNDGCCALEGIAPEVPIALIVRRGGDVLYEEPSPLTLQPGERRNWFCRIGAGARVFGVVLDQNESAVANQEVWLVAKDPNRADRPYYFFFQDARNVVQRTTTDVAGRFELTDVPAGTWWVGPAARGVKEAPSEAAVCPVAAIVAISSQDLEKELVLRVHRGLYIRGRVVLPDANAKGTFHVFTVSTDPMGYIGTESGVDGMFALGPLMPGEFRVAVIGRGDFAGSPYVVARAGDEDVVLRMSVAARLQLRAVDASDGARCVARFSVRRRDPPSWGPESWYSSSSSSGVVAGGLLEGTYDITARTEDGRIGVTRNVAVQAGVPPRDIMVRVGAGARLRMRLDGEAQVLSFDVVSDEMTVATDGLRAGTSTVVVVPAGRSIVRLRLGERVLEEREVTALVGEEVEVVFHRD